MRAALLLNALALGALAQGLPMDRTLSSDSPALLVKFVDGGKSVAAVCGDGKLRVWEAQSGTLLRTLGNDGMLVRAGFVQGDNTVASIMNDGSIQLRDVRKGSIERHVTAITPRAARVALSTGGSRVATAHMPDPQSGVNLIRVRDEAGKDLFRAPAGIGGISILGFSPDGSTLVAGSYDADVRVWSVRNGELVRLIEDLPASMFAMSFSPDGKWLATAGADRIVYIWDTATWKLARKLTGQPEMISALEFSPDGKRLATGGFSELTVAHPVTLIVWDVETARQLRVVPAPRRVGAVAFSPDGKQIATSFGEKSVNLWQVPD